MTIYFYYGDEDYNIEKAIEQKKEGLDKSFAAMNCKTHDHPSFVDLIAILRSQPMMFGKMVIIINCVDYFAKTFDDNELSELKEALDCNGENLDIIFAAILPREDNKKLDSRKKLFKLLSKYNAKEFPSFKTYKINDISAWLFTEAKKRDLTLNDDATLALIEQIGGNLRHFSNELDKLQLLAHPEKKITKEMVKEMCITNEDLFTFTDMLMQNKKDKALYEFMKLLDKRHPLEILLTLQTMLRKWITMKLKSPTMPPSEIAKLTGQHEFVVKKNIQQLRNTNLRDLVRLKQNLTIAEYRIKTGEAIDLVGEVQNAILQ